MVRNITRIWVLLGMLIISIMVVSAAPTAPKNIGTVTTSRYSIESTGFNVSAEAGNVTELRINATSITQTWQGYYGNVIGMIVLGDSSNNTLMDWSINGGIAGQIYATRVSSIADWNALGCSNAGNITAEDTALGSTGKPDAVNNTFSTSINHNAFFVGTTPIGPNNCSAVNLKNATAKSSDWQEVLLSSGANIVYTAILSNQKQGFNASNYDFQMIVGEDGHGAASTSTTPYYFWVELA